MKGRIGFLLVLALMAGGSGCAGTARRDDGSSIFGPVAWNAAPAPPQRSVAWTPPRTEAPADPSPRREGLARFFPDLLKRPADAPTATIAAAKPRPTWFGLRPAGVRSASTTTYMTDAREQLNRSVASPASPPVVLQAPTDRPSSDRQVTPTGTETVGDASTQPTVPVDDRTTTLRAEGGSGSSPSAPVFGSNPTRQGDAEATDPLPPAADTGPHATIVVGMPRVPSVDPLEDLSTDRAEAGKPASADDASSDELAVKANNPPAEPSPPSEPGLSQASTSRVVETSRMSAPASAVHASPQGAPPRPTSQVTPSSQVKPSPQGATGAKTWKRPCLRRLVRKAWKLGEYADPPTAAPH